LNSTPTNDQLALIGAGFGRTGTTSLKQALELLGLGPCYHMRVAMSRPGHARFWIRAKTDPAVDFRQFFRGYRATVDWPACEFYREIMATFPDAKVLLTVRDPEAWYESTKETLFAVEHALPWWFPRSILRMQDVVIWQGRLHGQFLDRESTLAAFNSHIEEVRRAVPPERLLEYRIEQGWGPLCDFLGLPVPVGIPFPRINDRKYFRRVLLGLRIANWAVPLGVLAVLAAAAA